MRILPTGAAALAVGIAAATPGIATALDWQNIADGMDSNPMAMAIDGADNLYLGGGFTTTGSVSANRIAKWDGAAWSALGPGLNGAVYAVATDATGAVYAGGGFTNVGGSAGAALQHVAKWNPATSTWTPLGSGINGSVAALAVDNAGNVYAGGTFTTAGGVNAANVAKWDGSSWQALGSGTANDVYSLAIDANGKVYVGGAFTTAGGIPAKRIARWDPTSASWSAVGPGLNGAVNALTLAPGSGVYAGGTFTQTDGGAVTLNGIGRWNGSSWASLGTGIGTASTPNVDSIVISGPQVYVAGQFGTAGGTVAGQFATWNTATASWGEFGPWVPPVNSPYSEARALARDAAGYLYVGGYLKDPTYLVTFMQRALVAQAPGAAAAPTAVGGDGRATVSWQPPANDGGGRITSYTVTSSPEGRTCTGAGTSCAVTGLSNGTAYAFAVTATNAAGTGPASASSAPVTPQAAPTNGGASGTGAGATAPAATTEAGGAPGAGAAPATLAARTRLRGRVLTTTGTLPRGATRVTQTARAGRAASEQPVEMARARTATGRCRTARGRFTCTIRLARGTWVVTTTARGASGVVAQGTRRLTTR